MQFASELQTSFLSWLSYAQEICSLPVYEQAAFIPSIIFIVITHLNQTQIKRKRKNVTSPTFFFFLWKALKLLYIDHDGRNYAFKIVNIFFYKDKKRLMEKLIILYPSSALVVIVINESSSCGERKEKKSFVEKKKIKLKINRRGLTSFSSILLLWRLKPNEFIIYWYTPAEK